jgi:hypothetical protein
MNTTQDGNARYVQVETINPFNDYTSVQQPVSTVVLDQQISQEAPTLPTKNEALSPGTSKTHYVAERRNALQPAEFTGEVAQYFQCTSCNHQLHHLGAACEQMIPNMRSVCTCADVCGTNVDHGGRQCGNQYTVIRNQDVRSWIRANDINRWGLADTIGPSFAELVFNDFKYAAALSLPEIPFHQWMKKYCGSWDEEQNNFMFHLCKSLRSSDSIKVTGQTAFDLQSMVDRRYRRHEHFIPVPEVRYLPAPATTECQCVHCSCAKCVPEVPCGCIDCSCRSCDKDTRPFALLAKDMWFAYALMLIGLLVLAAGIVCFIVLPITVPNKSQVWMYLVPAIIVLIGVLLCGSGCVFGVLQYRKLPGEFYRGSITQKSARRKSISSAPRVQRYSISVPREDQV